MDMSLLPWNYHLTILESKHISCKSVGKESRRVAQLKAITWMTSNSSNINEVQNFYAQACNSPASSTLSTAGESGISGEAGTNTRIMISPRDWLRERGSNMWSKHSIPGQGKNWMR